MEHPGNASMHSHPVGLGPYRALLGMTVLSYIAMYVLMYAMVDRWNNVFNNVNQLYMAGLMAIAALLVMLLCWFGIRTQAAVTDQQFVRSMIPHHAGAILMCGKNRLRDPDLQQLCREIVRSQEAEIERMKAELR